MRLIILITGLLLLTACTVSGWKPNQYTVKRGDTLFTIAWRYGLDYKQLAQWNGIAAPYRIYPGQQLSVSGPVSDQPAKGHQPMVAAKPKYSVPVHKSNAVRWRWPLEKAWRGQLLKSFQGASSASQGIDIHSQVGKPVYAAAAGKVVYSGNGLFGYGNLVIVKHNPAYISAYALNQSLLVKEGQKVVSGQRIATVGYNADKKAVLHFEIRMHGKPVNPLKYLPK